MKSPFLFLFVVHPTIVLSLTAVASGQIDHRVNRGNSAVGGRALDRNPGVGTGSFNLTRPGMNEPGAMSNAIITGNVTGLGAFHDESPVLQTNRFRDSLPSSGLSDFTARSVGLEEITSNRSFAPSYYFGTQETMPTAGQIGQGLNAPGSAKLSTPYTPPPSQNGPNLANQELRSLIRSPEDQRVQSGNLAPVTGLTQQRTTPSVSDGLRAINPSPYGSAMGSSIFGTPPPVKNLNAVPTSIRPLPGDIDLPWADRSGLGDERGLDDQVDLAGANSRIRQESEGVPIQEATNRRLADQDVVNPPIRSAGTTELPLAPEGPIPTPENLGDDRFADLYNAVELAQRFGARDMGFNIAPSADPVAPSAAPDAPRTIRDLIRKPSEGLNQLATAARWAKDVVDEPLQSFAGKYQDRLNDYISAGEADLRAGRFYAAARQFDLAATVDPVNPLPFLARGHAFLAAGDYLSAVHSIEQGIKRFPQIAAFRIDLPAVVGQHDIFDIRRADLETKLASSESYELRFLLGYCELYSGLPEEGLRNLERAAKDAPPESMIAIFADLVSGRRELPPVKP